MLSLPPKKTCIIIAGPTAVGKTGVAIQLAQHFNTSIISADSRQCFKELNIGVAKPTDQQLQQVKHYFINSHAITEDVNAGVFEQYSLAAVEEIFRDHHIAVMVGGTGLYIRAFCEGMDEIPVISKAVRDAITARYAAEGLAWLQQAIKEKDPAWYHTGEIQNPQRIMRALEVVEETGQSILSFRKEKKAVRNFDIVKIGLTLPREQLYTQIDVRTDKMIEDGLDAEVQSLADFRALNALQTVGYNEWFAYMDGTLSREKVIEDIKKNTRHYAKRQLTWFGKDKEIKWFSPLDFNQLIDSFHNLV